MSNSLVMGEFNSEKYWRSENLSRLPEFSDKNSPDIILSMDELLFSFCNDNDVLITRYRFNDSLKHYLNTIGFNFIVSGESVQKSIEESSKSIFQLMYENKDRISGVKAQINSGTKFSPYSVVPYCDVISDDLNLLFHGAKLDVVKEVNSKVYSCKVSKSLNLKYGGDITYNSRELSEKGEKLLEKGSFLIKDSYGVSGKGNLLINSPGILERIVKHLESQEKRGLASIFVVEPLLDRDIDFSCGFKIGKNGDVKIVSIQKMINNNFAYCGSYTADQEFAAGLYKNKYFEILEQVAHILYSDGYFGEVCLDSMILKSGDIVPIVEINARKSMGFINHRIDEYLSQFGQKGNLIFLNLGYRRELAFEHLLVRMDKEGLIFYPGKTNGVMPLSANTLFINKELDNKEKADAVYKGRIYFSVIAEDEEKRESLIKAVRALFKSLLCNIYN